MVRSKKYDGILNVYCNDEVANAIKNIYPYLFPDVYGEVIDKYLNIVVLNNNETRKITNREYTLGTEFFDTKKKIKLF